MRRPLVWPVIRRCDAAAKMSPIVVHITACVPSDATRKFHRVTAGNAAGTSSTPGSTKPAARTRTRKDAMEASKAVVEPHRPASHLPSRTAAAAATTDQVSINRYSSVRAPIVSGLPTDGGLAGYFKKGTRNTTTNAPAASHIVVRAGLARPTRP